ncbi:DUF6092 family protein [Fervidicoccus fontis]|uniref:Uncharacterized protein n=1 Tax=Fervidicoccus fontis TaxID=683846 RepID=A0A7C2VBZ5_9CREN|nr:DUF6092 family protein [Fervidicoccus fontis]PMB76286.1 MAG: hypothetical protein C0177_06970 [Fervidicoccus fontis]HEW63528.1 hypothetical protein [Fervidicoccus fontis]
MTSLEDLLKSDQFKLLSFLITSARGCVDEPALYGPLRLVDAAARLIRIWEKEDEVPAEIVRLRVLIEEKEYSVMYNEEEFISFLNELSKEIAKLIKE